MYEARVLQAAHFLRSYNRREIICLIGPKVGEMAAVRGRGKEDGRTQVSPPTQCLGSSIRTIERKTHGYGLTGTLVGEGSV